MSDIDTSAGKIALALNLLNSMILGGERHSPESELVFYAAKDELGYLRTQLAEAKEAALEEAAMKLSVSLPEGGSGEPQDRTDKLIDDVRREDVKFIRSLKSQEKK